MKKQALFASTIILTGLLVVGCSATTPGPEQPTEPSTEYVVEEDNVPLTDDMKPTDVTLTVNESGLPEGFIKEEQTQEETTSGITPESSTSDKTINFTNADETCFLGVNLVGQQFPEGTTDYTTTAVEGLTGLVENPKISTATIPSAEGSKPLEVSVIESTVNEVHSFTAVRVFNVDVPTNTLTEAGDPATGKQVLMVTYSCNANTPISGEDFQNILNTVTVSYTTS